MVCLVNTSINFRAKGVKSILLIPFLLFPFLLHAGYNPTVHGVPEIEYNALVALYDAVDGSNSSRYYHWVEDETPVSLWKGITVESGHVTKISIIIDIWQWYMPEGIYDLTELKEITIVNGSMQGSFSSRIANLKKLEILDIMNGDHYSGFPKEIAELTNLKELSLSGFRKSEQFPNLSTIKGLKKLSLHGNYFTGEFPIWITKLDSLEYLELDHNNLTGTLPYELNDMKKVWLLRLWSNKFDAQPFPDISQMDSLRILDLTDCNIVGKLPENLFTMKGITGIALGENFLTGKIPDGFRLMPNLRSLQLYDNNFDLGPIPDFGESPRLNSLDLSNCNLTGEIPEWMAERKEWTYLNLTENSLSGTIPEQLFLHNDLYLYLSKNRFTDISFPNPSGLKLRLSLQNNRLEFDDIVPVIRNNSWTSSYSPQDSIGINSDTILPIGTDFTLNIKSQYTGNLFQWYKNGIAIGSQSESSVFVLPQISETDEGNYSCKVTNPAAPDLTLNSRSISLEVAACFPITNEVDVSICEGESYHGRSQEGVYTDSLVGYLGCDSIVITTINLIPTFHISENVSICHGDNYLGWTESGSYDRILQSTLGCDSTLTTILDVKPKYNYLEEVSICPGGNYHGWEHAGYYERNLQSVHGCDSVVTTILKVHPENRSTITRFADTLRCDRTYKEYFWYFNNQLVELVDSFRLDILESGNYIVVGLDANGCYNSSDSYYFSPVDKIYLSTEQQVFSLLPNPSNGELTIQIQKQLLPTNVFVTNAMGQIVYQRRNISSENFVIDFAPFHRGIYFITLGNMQAYHTEKISFIR